MPYTKVLFVSYAIPTYFPSDPHAGGVAAANGAPTVQLDDADLQARAQRMVNVLFFAYQQLKKSAASDLADPSVLKVFIAPEFYFRNASQADLASSQFERARDFWGSYPRRARDELMTALQGVVGTRVEFTDWTVVAGTVCSWAEEDVDRVPFLNNSGMVIRGPRATADGSASAIFVEKHYFSRIDLNYDDEVGNQRWNVRQSMSSVFSERKNPDFTLDNLVRWDGQLQGVEICLDHARNVVRAGLQTLTAVFGQAVQVDLQLITACGMSVEHGAIAAVDGGLVLLADGAVTRSQMARWSAGRVTYIQESAYVDLPDDNDHTVGTSDLLEDYEADQGLYIYPTTALRVQA